VAKPKYVADPTFTQWLLALRPTRYRRILDFIVADRERWPHRARTLLTFVRHVNAAREQIADTPTERMVRAAWVAYEKDLANGRKIVARNGAGKLPDNQRRRTHSYSLAPTTDARLRKIQSFVFGKRGSRGTVIDRLVDDYFREHMQP
jgi:hypothetical protein